MEKTAPKHCEHGNYEIKERYVPDEELFPGRLVSLQARCHFCKKRNRALEDFLIERYIKQVKDYFEWIETQNCN